MLHTVVFDFSLAVIAALAWIIYKRSHKKLTQKKKSLLRYLMFQFFHFQFPSLETSNNPLAKTVKAILTSSADYFAYTNDLKTSPTKLGSVPDKNVRN